MLMRWSMMIVMIAGCAGPSASEDLTDLQARATDCGTITDACDNGMPTPPIVACMNDALQAGVLARTHWGDYDSKMYEWSYDVFTDGRRVRVFHTEPGDAFADPTVSEETSCAGPFAVSAMMICGTHPLIDATGCSFPSY